jgi:hypothetical protein
MAEAIDQGGLALCYPFTLLGRYLERRSIYFH